MDEFSDINKVWTKLPRRAEREVNLGKITQSFTAVPAVIEQLSAKEAGVVFGRRGTGKTHAMRYLAARRTEAGDAAVYLDLKQIGSTHDIYTADEPLHVRATHLLQDVVEAFHGGLLKLIVDDGLLADHLTQLSPALDQVVEAATKIVIQGSATSLKSTGSVTVGDAVSGRIDLTANPGSASGTVGRSRTKTRESSASLEVTQQGTESLFMHLGSLADAMCEVGRALRPKRVWLLLDEWSEVPPDLQPLLADMLKRAFLPAPKVSVKIAAIQHRSRFRGAAGAWQGGIELGSDTVGSIDLDETQAVVGSTATTDAFIHNVLTQHFMLTSNELFGRDLVDAGHALSGSFEPRGLQHLVLASEGNPRDAINIAGAAASLAGANRIGISHVLEAAHNYFWNDKMAQVEEQALGDLLADAMDASIKRGVRTFLVSSNHPRIERWDALYDLRAIHLIRVGMRNMDKPAVTYRGYAVDFGAYADQISLKKMTWRNDEWVTERTRAFEAEVFSKWTPSIVPRGSAPMA